MTVFLTVPSSDIARLLEAIKAVRKSDCGAWLICWAGIFSCEEGREKRQELARLLDELYKVAEEVDQPPEGG